MLYCEFTEVNVDTLVLIIMKLLFGRTKEDLPKNKLLGWIVTIIIIVIIFKHIKLVDCVDRVMGAGWCNKMLVSRFVVCNTIIFSI